MNMDPSSVLIDYFLSLTNADWEKQSITKDGNVSAPSRWGRLFSCGCRTKLQHNAADVKTAIEAVSQNIILFPDLLPHSEKPNQRYILVCEAVKNMNSLIARVNKQAPDVNLKNIDLEILLNPKLEETKVEEAKTPPSVSSTPRKRRRGDDFMLQDSKLFLKDYTPKQKSTP